MRPLLISSVLSVFLLNCFQSNPDLAIKGPVNTPEHPKELVSKTKRNNPEVILSKPEVPILCYHRIRKILPTDGENMKTYSVEPDTFDQQMKILSENGYHTILPDQLYNYLVHDGSLPSNPVMITFDDDREEQFRLGATIMEKYGFKGVFFIMTVTLNKPGYMSKAQVKELSDRGNVIGAHTWDHHMVTKYKDADWELQLVKPKKELEAITGKKVNYFAYPNGVWNYQAVTKLKNSNYLLAFTLFSKRDPKEPLYTIRRISVHGFLSASEMLKSIETTFKKQPSKLPLP